MGTYLLITPKQNELYHHGIKGQKWGVRRFQNKDGTRTKAGKDRAKYIRERKLSDEQKLKKNWKDGSGYLVGNIDRDLQEKSVRTRGGQRFYTTAAKTMKDFLADTGDVPPDFKPMKKFTSFEEADLSYVNPSYGQPGTTQNCAKSTVATELMRYGVAVTAGRQVFPSSSDAMSYWFDGAEKKTGKLDDMERTLAGYGDGASGSISGYYPGGAGGHCMHFSVSGGKVHVQDGQNGRKFGSIREAAETYGFDTEREMSSFRLDTATPNWDHLAEDSVIGPPRWQERAWTFTNDGSNGQGKHYTNYDVSEEWGRDYDYSHYGRRH